MPSYSTVGNWLFLIGSLLFTFDAIDNAWVSCSMRSFLILAACCLFTTGCILFLLDVPAKVDSQQ
jgi:cytochrome c oxidase assembly factor CtaG